MKAISFSILMVLLVIFGGVLIVANSSPLAQAGVLPCDVNNDGIVNRADLLLIRDKNGQAASGPADPFDPNHDGQINVADVRYCQLRCTNPNCS